MKTYQISRNASFIIRVCSFSIFALAFFLSIIFLSGLKNPLGPAIIGTGVFGLICMIVAKSMKDLAVSVSAAVVYVTASATLLSMISISLALERTVAMENIIFLAASGGITVIAAGAVKTLFGECVQAEGVKSKNAFVSLLIQFLAFFTTFIASALGFK